MVGNFENWTTISGIFSQLTAAHAQNLKPPWAVSYLTTNFGAAYYKI